MRWSWRKRRLQRIWSGQQRPHQRTGSKHGGARTPAESNVSKPAVEVARAVSGTMLRKWGSEDSSGSESKGKEANRGGAG